MKTTTQKIILIAAATTLSACANMNLFKDSAAPPSSSIATPPPPADVEQPITATPTALSAAQIKSLMTGKSWAWNGPKNSGVTLYASDGTSLVQVTGKGTTSGKWIAKDGQLCESFSPATFIPQGVPMACQTFTGTAGVYKVGQATFKIAS
jgi:Protein of unknown function (DUF995)